MYTKKALLKELPHTLKTGSFIFNITLKALYNSPCSGVIWIVEIFNQLRTLRGIDLSIDTEIINIFVPFLTGNEGVFLFLLGLFWFVVVFGVGTKCTKILETLEIFKVGT